MAIEVERRLINVHEYHKMGEAGILWENDIELINGEILKMSPIGSNHAGTVAKLVRLLSSPLASFVLWIQNPVQLDDHSEPEPDLAILKFRDDFYVKQLPAPADILLVIEVADSSLAFDQQVKLPLYAGSGIPNYWLIDLTKRELTWYQEPRKEQYTQIRIFDRDKVVEMEALSFSLDLKALF